ncbi:MAG: carboxypeptidase-like regulatory domain-containing protein [Bacteroidales bacterium]|nr:carboxypeptidase-like regulatory domain-containing protein [Bacteroidales bacterium]
MVIRHRWLLSLFLLMINISVSFSQTGSIKGIVFDESNGEPIGFAAVLLKGTTNGTITDDNGIFSINGVPEGEHEIRISYIGYDSLVAAVTVSAKSTPVQKYYIRRHSIELEGMEIRAEKVIAQTETRVAVINITPKQITRMPSIGGVPDLAQYLQVLPGVIFTGDQGGQLYIRGGTPIQNKVLLDGLVVYNPFHSIGLFSVFDTDILKNAQVYTAGFGAEYGGRISSIMDIKTRDGNKKRLSGKVDVSTFSSKVVLEGPFAKQTESRNTSVSFVLSLKGSYLEQSSKWLYKYADANGLPYNYLDGYGKISIETGNGNKVNLFGFSFNDKVRYPNIATFKWNSWGGGTSFLFIPYNSKMIIEGTVAISSYKIDLDEEITPERNSSINTMNIGMDFSYLTGKNTLSYGLEVLGTWTDYKFTSAYGLGIRQHNFNSELGLYLKYKWTLKKFLIEPGFRLQAFASQSSVSPEPRLAIKYNITDNVRLKLSAGLYAQNIMSATSDQDVVNLFYGFLTVPENIVHDSIRGRKVKSSVQKAQHAVFGLEWDPIPSMTINIEGYVKNFSQLTNINRYQIFNTDEEFILESGIAYGGDINAKWEYKRFYFSVVYSLNWVTRNDGIIIYRTHFDRRHNINLLASYSFGKRNCWEIDVRWNYGSGFPFTKTRGFYPQLTYIETLSGDIIKVNEDLGIALDTINRGQLPDYHRLDVNIKRRFFVSETCLVEVGIGATNMYNYSNIFYVNRVTAEKIYQLPILWSANVNVSF